MLLRNASGSSTSSWRCSARSLPLKPHSLDLASLCPTALCARMRCRCWTGGCPWTPGATSSLRRRARRRGSERAPRAARARRELEPQTYPRRVKSLHPWSKEKFLVSRYYPLSKFEGNALKLSSRLSSSRAESVKRVHNTSLLPPVVARKAPARRTSRPCCSRSPLHSASLRPR